ncbi:hypothetical protein ACFYOK_38305 [Microbispora bryophytorum]|uniref:hypothetical protein n=1 Tax=Microbispora bryophytorum TaxID=1460882 RepID=UPI0033DA08EC
MYLVADALGEQGEAFTMADLGARGSRNARAGAGRRASSAAQRSRDVAIASPGASSRPASITGVSRGRWPGGAGSSRRPTMSPLSPRKTCLAPGRVTFPAGSFITGRPP